MTDKLPLEKDRPQVQKDRIRRLVSELKSGLKSSSTKTERIQRPQRSASGLLTPLEALTGSWAPYRKILNGHRARWQTRAMQS